VLFKLLEVCTI